MSSKATAAAIRGRFQAEWGATTAVAYENTTFDPPKDADGEPLPWVRLVVRTGEASQADMAEAPRFRHPGAAVVQVFTKHGSGDGRARDLAGRAEAIFRRFQSGGLAFRAPYQTVVGSDGSWFQINVTAPFFHDQVF